MIPWVGGGIGSDPMAVILCGSTVNAPFGVRNLGDNPLNGENPGGVPPPGGKTDNELTPLATRQQDLELPTASGYNEGGEAGVNGGLN